MNSQHLGMPALGLHSTSWSAVRHGGREAQGTLPLTGELDATDSRETGVIAFSYVLTGDLTKCHWIVPFVTQKTLVKLNRSQNKTKSHESGRGTVREKEGLIGMGGR